MDITKQYLINGPNNVIRLTNGEKVMYIFGDYHKNINDQNECSINKDYDSLNIDQFLVKFMKSTDKEFDFFIEQELTDVDYYKNTNYELRYIEELRKLFSKNMKFEKNKILKSDNFPNIRFHYFDFRHNFPQMSESSDVSDVYHNMLPFYKISSEIDNIILKYKNVKNEIIAFHKNINKDSENKFILKIYNKFENKEIHKKIVTLMEKYFKKNFYNIIINAIDDLLEYIYENYDSINNKYLSLDLQLEINIEIRKKMDFIQNNILLIFQITDIYIIKRFLDKKYIKNTIVYTGSSHLLLITYFLVKYFDFKISNLYYLDNSIKDINELEENIKNDKLNYLNLLNLFTKFDDSDEIDQCINLFDFPNNLS
jgi:hypothetical protein